MFENIKIVGGLDKSGQAESLKEVVINRGESLSVVGFTGSGKSQLIRDIESLAQKDTVTKRQILTDGIAPEYKLRRNPEYKIVSHLSQNMNYVLDMECAAFLKLRAECRKSEIDTERVLSVANSLCGEEILPNMPLTRLSGGQSRALMIADTAINADSPIILIDEIENAGIDKNAAMQTLTGSNKIIIVVTHDPLLALAADKRIVMGNGGMRLLFRTSESEKKLHGELEQMSSFILDAQKRIRNGEAL